jgi:hypothetical protein
MTIHIQVTLCFLNIVVIPYFQVARLHEMLEAAGAGEALIRQEPVVRRVVRTIRLR